MSEESGEQIFKNTAETEAARQQKRQKSVHWIASCSNRTDVSDLMEESKVLLTGTMQQAVGVNQDTRLSTRVFDLSSPAKEAILSIQSNVENASRKLLLSLDFDSIHTPKLDYIDQPASLALSSQFHKQMAICGGFPRVFEVGPYLKAEDSLSPQNLSEFTVLDVELELTYHFSEIMDLVDKLLVFIFSHLNDRCVSHLEAVNKQYPFGPLQFFQKTKRLSFVQGIKLLEESGVEVSDPLGDLSSELKRRLGQIVFEKYGTDLYMLYHCPSIARPFFVMPCENDDRYCNSFDVFLRGEEIISGGQHVHDADFLEKRATDCKIDAQDISPYIDSFRCGTPLHGGFRMVLERVAMLFCGLN